MFLEKTMKRLGTCSWKDPRIWQVPEYKNSQLSKRKYYITEAKERPWSSPLFLIFGSVTKPIKCRTDNLIVPFVIKNTYKHLSNPHLTKSLSLQERKILIKIIFQKCYWFLSISFGNKMSDRRDKIEKIHQNFHYFNLALISCYIILPETCFFSKLIGCPFTDIYQ